VESWVSEPAGFFAALGSYWLAMVRSETATVWTVVLLNQSAMGLEAPGTVQYTG
jgi:hypothetical protein